jgi:hypothetical protein
LKILELLDLTQRQGPPTQFHSWHLLAAFLSFCQTFRPIGRYKLSEELGLGGGSIRSLIIFLRRRNLIEPVARQGHQLSKKGKKHCIELHQVLVKLEQVPATSYSIDIKNYGCHLRHCAQKVTDGLAQRDAALKAGATGATTFIQGPDPNTLTMPKAREIPQNEVDVLIKPFDLQKGDVLIIGSGPIEILARLGTLAAALTIL